MKRKFNKSVYEINALYVVYMFIYNTSKIIIFVRIEIFDPENL